MFLHAHVVEKFSYAVLGIKNFLMIALWKKLMDRSEILEAILNVGFLICSSVALAGCISGILSLIKGYHPYWLIFITAFDFNSFLFLFTLFLVTLIKKKLIQEELTSQLRVHIKACK
jgi:hypothetical protein